MLNHSSSNQTQRSPFGSSNLWNEQHQRNLKKVRYFDQQSQLNNYSQSLKQWCSNHNAPKASDRLQSTKLGNKR